MTSCPSKTNYVIRAPRVQEFEALTDLVLMAFAHRNPNMVEFPKLFPDAIRADEECMRDWRVAEMDGRLVAAVQIVPQTYVAHGLSFLSGGIGQVSALPEARGQGLMTAVLTEAIASMEAMGCAISILGGDRQRYRRFGWEWAGSSRRVSLGDRRASAAPVQEADGAVYSRWKGDLAVVPECHAAYQRLPWRQERPLERQLAVMQRSGIVVWHCRVGGGFAYVALSEGEIQEYAGDRVALESLLVHLLKARGFSVVLPPQPVSGELEAMMMDYAHHYHVQTTAMVRIFTLERVVRAWEPYLAPLAAELRGSRVWRVRETGETIRLEIKEGRLSWAAGSPSDKAEVELGRADWARLLFGPFPPDEGWPYSAWERTLFPLPLHWPGLSHI